MAAKQRAARVFAHALALALVSSPAMVGHAEELFGTLKKVRAAGVVVIGYRESSIPFSYLSARNEPIGYSIDICRNLVDAISEELGRDISIKWQPVTSENRLQAVTSGQVDLECGSTTSNIERQKQVAFSPIVFVAGTKLMVKNGSTVRSFRDLNGKTVAVTAGTTNEKTIRELKDKFKLSYTVLVGKDHAESFALVTDGKADAFATDDVLLYGLIAKNKMQDQYTVIGEYLSYDPYGIMYRKDDPQLAKLVQTAFQKMGEANEFEYVYNTWFLKRLPSGERLNLPMSAQLESIVRSLSAKPE